MFRKKLYREALRLYTGQHVLNYVEKHGEKALKLSAETEHLTLFFQDVSGFTSLAEGFSPKDLVNLLHEYLEVMTEAIIGHNGAIDKCMGVAIMAIWGIDGQSTHSSDACKCALDCVQRLEAINKRFVRNETKVLKPRIGINTGQVIIGNLGSSNRFTYTVMGDNVNLASRLEGANKRYGTEILISEYTRKEIDDSFLVKEVDTVHVKGKEEPVRLYTLEAMGS